MRQLIAILMVFCVAIPAFSDEQATGAQFGNSCVLVGEKIRNTNSWTKCSLGDRPSISMVTGPGLPLLFTIKDRNGKTIAYQITEDQIREKHLDLYNDVKKSIAIYNTIAPTLVPTRTSSPGVK